MNILTENDKQITQPKHVKIELMCHQRTMIQKMMEIEKTGMINVDKFQPGIFKGSRTMTNFDLKKLSIETNKAILGDSVGAGKTLMIASLISVKRTVEERELIMDSGNYYSIKVQPNLTKVSTNLIIVPHKLLPQWSETFSKYIENLNIYTIAYNRDIDAVVKKIINIKNNIRNQQISIESEEVVPERINNYNVILIGETMYRRFYKCCENIQFNRVFIDEADSIKLPKEMTCNFNFLWLVTGTPTGLFYNDKPFVSKLFSKMNPTELTNHFIFKNDNKYIEQSIVLPHPKRLKIKCITPRELSIIKDVIPPSVLQMINAGNSDEAIKALNCNVDTNENILQVVTKNISDSIKNKEVELEAEKKKIYNVNMQKEHESKIKMIENQIIKLQEKYEDIKKKIYDLNDSICPICMGEFTKPVITGCCKSCFCFDCLAVSLGELKNNKCPNCRFHITHSDLHVISENKEVAQEDQIKQKKYELKDKMDVLVDLIQNKPDGSFMIFANYSETFNKIELKLKELGISYHILKGQAATVKSFIDDFKSKKVRVLMLNATFFGAGMNLQMTTDLIMFHRFKPEMEEQIIGRAQRLGRTTALNVYYLLHDNESNDIDDKFNFEDQGSVHYMDWLEQNSSEKKSNTVNDHEINPDKKDLDVFTIKMIDSDEDPELFKTNSSGGTNTNTDIQKNKDKKVIKKEELSEEEIDNMDPDDYIEYTKKNIFTKTKSKNNHSDSDSELEESIEIISMDTNKKANIKDESESDSESDHNDELSFDDFEIIN